LFRRGNAGNAMAGAFGNTTDITLFRLTCDTSVQPRDASCARICSGVAAHCTVIGSRRSPSMFARQHENVRHTVSVH